MLVSPAVGLPISPAVGLPISSAHGDAALAPDASGVVPALLLVSAPGKDSAAPGQDSAEVAVSAARCLPVEGLARAAAFEPLQHLAARSVKPKQSLHAAVTVDAVVQDHFDDAAASFGLLGLFLVLVLLPIDDYRSFGLFGLLLVLVLLLLPLLLLKQMLACCYCFCCHGVLPETSFLGTPL